MFPLPIHVLSRAVDWENPRVHQFSLYTKENMYMYSTNMVLPIVLSLKLRTIDDCDYKTLCGKPHQILNSLKVNSTVPTLSLSLSY